MRYKLETNDKHDFTLAFHGSDLYLSIYDMDKWLRNEIKHGNISSEKKDALQAARDELHNILSEHGVSTDMVP